MQGKIEQDKAVRHLKESVEEVQALYNGIAEIDSELAKPTIVLQAISIAHSRFEKACAEYVDAFQDNGLSVNPIPTLSGQRPIAPMGGSRPMHVAERSSISRRGGHGHSDQPGGRTFKPAPPAAARQHSPGFQAVLDAAKAKGGPISPEEAELAARWSTFA